MENNSILVSGNNDKGTPILSFLTKRTYKINEDGKCNLSEEQLPLKLDLEYIEEKSCLFINDTDAYPFKTHTDIVVKGKARSVKLAETFICSVEIAKIKLDIRVIGNRNVFKNKSGIFEFNTLNNITEIPLEYEFAYGGKDLLAEKHYREKIEADKNFKHLDAILNIYNGSLYRYPRNPEGKGYILDPTIEAIEQLELPNLEDPYNILTSENFICPSLEDWHKMPLPQATDWVSSGWFPRVAYFGKYPIPKGFTEDSYEIMNELVEKNILNSSFSTLNDYFNFRSCNGASLGLQSRYLHGGESCRLINIHPNKSDFVFKLPNEQPKIKIDNRKGKLINADVNMHSVIIEPDLQRLSIVWCGSIKALRPYMDEELLKMPSEVKW